MGVAHVKCVAGCTCAAADFDGNGADPNSQTAMYALIASPHDECNVKFQV